MSAAILLLITASAATALTPIREDGLKFQTSIAGLPFYQEPCHSDIDVTVDYLQSLYKFAIETSKAIGQRSDYHFLFSPMAMWLILAAIAEGADRTHQQEMFTLLGLPSDYCLREKYYKIATTRILPGDDVNVFDTRILVIDEDLNLNSNWYNFVKKNFLIDVVTAPIRRDPYVAIREMQRLVSGSLHSFNLIGNSVILDVVDYNALWATAFHDAVLEKEPFYDHTGTRIGSVDLMRVKRKIRVAHLPHVNLKLMELTVGIGNRYRMVFALALGDTDLKACIDLLQETILFEFLDGVEESHTVLDIAIPRFTFTSEIDARQILEDMGVVSPWSEAGATSYISSPPALPSSFVQRTTVIIDGEGLGPPELTPRPPGNTSTGVHPAIGRDFIVNRPFLFALLDAETYSIIITSAFMQPTYTD